MNAFLYGLRLQFKLDIRAKTLLITCYIVPLLFFAIMGCIFTSLMSETKDTLIASMTIMGVSMGALIGVPPSLVDLYGTNQKKMYRANGVPLYVGVFTLTLSAFLHLMIMSILILIIAPIAFDANIPSNLIIYFPTLALFTIVSLSMACVLGLFMKNQGKLTMISQLLFLPSIMLSGIMFSSSLLPSFLESFGKLFPATWGYHILANRNIEYQGYVVLLVMLVVMVIVCRFLLKHQRRE